MKRARHNINKLYWLDVTVWNTWIAICIGNPAQWTRAIRNVAMPDAAKKDVLASLRDQRNAAARVVWHEDYSGYVFMQFYPNVYESKSRQYGAIAHEAVHAASRVLRSHGTPLTEASEEAYSYLTEYIVRSIHDAIEPKGKP